MIQNKKSRIYIKTLKMNKLMILKYYKYILIINYYMEMNNQYYHNIFKYYHQKNNCKIR